VTNPQKAQLLIIGIGNLFRGDDAAGLLAARIIKDAGFDPGNIAEHSGEGASLMEIWKAADAVILIDAVSSGSAPGTIHRLEPIGQPLPVQMFRSSTHAFSLPDAIEMARALDQLPRRLVVFGIEGRNFQAGADPSPEVCNALPQVAALVVNEADSLMKAAIDRGD